MHDYKQQFDVDFNNTWIEVMKSAFFKSLFVLAEIRNLYIYQMNVVIAFLYEMLKEVIYVSQSNDFIEDFTLICELRKAFYDLKQSSRVWYNIIQKFLKSLDFVSTEADVSVFIHENKQTFICVYVDDVLLFKSDLNLLKLIKIKLSEHFKMTDLRSSSHYLSMKIIRSSNRINLNQTFYLLEILKQFEMTDCKSMNILMKLNIFNVMILIDDDYKANSDIIYWYSSMIESLMYAMIMTRSDLIYSLSVLSRYCFNSNSTHIKAAIRVLRYIKKTLNYNIHYEDKEDLIKYIDADYAEIIDDRRSIDDYAFFLSENFISWSFKRQNLITQSSCELKYVVLSEIDKEVIWLRQLLHQLKIISKKMFTVVWADNQKTIVLVENSKFHRRIKHIDAKYHWIRKTITDDKISLKYFLISKMIADELIKPLNTKKFAIFLNMINMLH